MKFECKSFSQLTVDELYAILKLRSIVFVVEQNCVYLDLDDLDKNATHVFGIIDDEISSYARILNPNTLYKEPSIGRVVTSPDHRGKSLGKEIFTRTLQEVNRLFPAKPVRIMAQSYLIRFYQEFDFQVAGKEFLEDGIPHVEMLKY